MNQVRQGESKSSVVGGERGECVGAGRSERQRGGDVMGEGLWACGGG